MIFSSGSEFLDNEDCCASCKIPGLPACLTREVWGTYIKPCSVLNSYFYFDTHHSMLLRTMGPKTRAETQRAYRERKKQRDGVTKKPKKPRNEIQRSYREKKKLENKDAFLEKERNHKRKSYIPISLLTEPEEAKRRKASQCVLGKSQGEMKKT